MFDFITKKKKKLAVQNDNKRTTILDIKNFNVSEAYKQLRTNLIFTLSARESNIIEFSSSFPGEGKSITAANTAITISQASSKVLLIDCDMRKPVQHKIFNLKNDVGISTVLGKMTKFEETVHKNVVNNLDVLTCGPIPPNPSELITSKKMQGFLEEISSKYEYIVLDTPPINTVTDAMVLSKYCAGLVLVVRHGVASYDDVKRTLTAVKMLDTDVIGFVLNGVEDSKFSGRKYGGYGKKYGYSYRNHYGYGYDYAEQENFGNVSSKKK